MVTLQAQMSSQTVTQVRVRIPSIGLRSVARRWGWGWRREELLRMRSGVGRATQGLPVQRQIRPRSVSTQVGVWDQSCQIGRKPSAAGPCFTSLPAEASSDRVSSLPRLHRQRGSRLWPWALGMQWAAERTRGNAGYGSRLLRLEARLLPDSPGTLVL